MDSVLQRAKGRMRAASTGLANAIERTRGTVGGGGGSRGGMMLWSVVIVSTLSIFFLFYRLKGELGTFLTWIAGLSGAQGPVLFGALFILVSFPMTWGYIVLNFGAGYLYGFWLGLVTVMYGATLGAVVAFLVCKTMCRNYITTKFSSNEHMSAILRVMDGKEAVKIVMLTRLSPVPFGLQNAIFSLTHVAWWRYALATSVGLLPTQALNTYIGTSLHSMQEVISGKGDMDVSGFSLLIGQLVIGIGLSYWVFKKARAEFDKAISTGRDGGDIESAAGTRPLLEAGEDVDVEKGLGLQMAELVPEDLSPVHSDGADDG